MRLLKAHPQNCFALLTSPSQGWNGTAVSRQEVSPLSQLRFFGCGGEQPHGHGAPKHTGPRIFPNEPGHRPAFKIPTGHSAREGKDPRFTFAALTGGQPHKERYCVTAASPLHPSQAPLHLTCPGAPCSPTPRHDGDVGTGEATASALGGLPSPCWACYFKGTS